MTDLKAFTLAELLIALAILGVIATFTIPKVLTSQNNAKYNAIAKEAMAMISGAYETYKMDSAASINTSPADLTPYMNYVNVDTVSEIGNGGSTNCAWDMCLKLHNGALLYIDATMNFGVLDRAHYIAFRFDPDGQYIGGASDPGQSIDILLYANGKLTLPEHSEAGDVTIDNGAPLHYATPTPDWFSWN